MNQMNTKNYWKQKKRLCVRWLGVINTIWENLKIAKHKSVTCWFSSVDWFVLCDLQIFSGSVYHPEPPHAQSLFLFPIVFGINWILILKLLEIEKEIVREVVRGDKHNLRKSANRNAQISVIHSAHCTDLCFAICRFSQVVFVTSNNFTHNLLFYFQ